MSMTTCGGAWGGEVHATIAHPRKTSLPAKLNLRNLIAKAADRLGVSGRGPTPPPAPYPEGLRDGMGPQPWCIDEISIDAGVLRFRGWALPPGGDPARVQVRVDGTPVETFQYGLARPDIARIYWYMPHAAMSGFTCSTRLARTDTPVLEPHVLSFHDAQTGAPVFDSHTCYYYDPHADDLALPPPANRRRVHGDEFEQAFRIEGYTTFFKMRKVLRERFGRDFTDFKAILDWGCGCGRMTRYFHWLPAGIVTGIDIDADNVEWCRRNYAFGTFETVPMHPPTALPAERFDLVIGISVMTHLLEPEMHEWLGELRRITAPGALLLLTTHGDATAARSALPEPLWRTWKARGFVDAGANPDLESSMQVQDYYRNTFMTTRYVREKWGRYFEVVDFVPAYIGNHQDLVILRKR
jgi:SAM-dependent methyltransferase